MAKRWSIFPCPYRDDPNAVPVAPNCTCADYAKISIQRLLAAAERTEPRRCGTRNVPIFATISVSEPTRTVHVTQPMVGLHARNWKHCLAANPAGLSTPRQRKRNHVPQRIPRERSLRNCLAWITNQARNSKRRQCAPQCKVPSDLVPKRRFLHATSRATNDWEIMESGAVTLMLRVLKSLSGLVSARTFPSIALYTR